jgi:hypothetical protein
MDVLSVVTPAQYKKKAARPGLTGVSALTREPLKVERWDTDVLGVRRHG